MEYQRILNLLDNATNLDDSRGKYKTNSQIKFKASMIMSSLCDYSDAYILVSGTITVAAQERNNPNNAKKEVVFRNCAPFTDSIIEINNILQIDNAKYIYVIMSMFNLIEYSYNYSKTSGSL